MPRVKKYSVTLGEADKDRIEKLSKRYKLSMSEITGYLYEMCEKYDMMKVGWESRIEKADEKRIAKSNSCPAFTFREKWYICLQGREKKGPKITKLSRKLSEALDMCEACEKWKQRERDELNQRRNALSRMRERKNLSLNR